MTVEMVPLDSIRADPANPRRADEERLTLVELSLSRLGWLLPVYISPDGELLSGHQRTTIAARMGATHVPAERVTIPAARKAAVNVLFNRATNDMTRGDMGGAMAEGLSASVVIASADHLPRLDVSDFAAWCPVLNAVTTPVDAVARTAGSYPYHDKHSVDCAAELHKVGVTMPIVLDDDGHVINGWGRLQRAIEAKEETVQVVRCPPERASLARLLLNRLSMDFALEDQYADILRFNSFRRARGREKHLNRTMTALIFRHTARARGQRATSSPPSARFTGTPAQLDLWRKINGQTVVDFGAGLCDKTALLLGWGIDAIPFEPYYTGGSDSEFAVPEARDMARRFLARVAAGDRFDSIFLAAVLNSVPFRGDREMIIAICAALCYGHPTSQVIAGLDGIARFASRNRAGYAAGGANDLNFVGEYEPGVMLAGWGTRSPKMQKYHTLPEFRQLWGTQFERVDVWMVSRSFMCAHARRPHKPDPDLLARSLAFEFDLPYPHGERLGLASEAFSAFEQRLNIKLPRRRMSPQRLQ